MPLTLHLSIYLLSVPYRKKSTRNFQVLEKKNYLEQRVRLCPSLIYFYSPVMNRIPVMYSLPEIFEMVFSKVVHDKDYLYIKKENDNCQLLPFCFKYFHILPIFYYYLLPVISILYRIIRNEDR